MAYQKLTLEVFLEKLGLGEYKGITGARRAIGKVDWSAKEKVKAQESLIEYFGSAGDTAKKAKKPAGKTASAPKPKKAAKEAPAKKAAPSTGAKRGRKPKIHFTEAAEAAPLTAAASRSDLRETAAANVVLALKPFYLSLSVNERLVYNTALAEFLANASVVVDHQESMSTQEDSASKVTAKAEVFSSQVLTAPPGKPPQVVLPGETQEVSGSHMTEAQRQAFLQSATAVKASLPMPNHG